jgi:hypothetical protein
LCVLVFFLEVFFMMGGREQAPARVPNEGGPARPSVKGKNFNREEEEQLCKSVFFVSQDRIVGNRQRVDIFWERICEHYEDHKPDAPRPKWSLETKWGLIKHDVSSFRDVYAQVLRLWDKCYGHLVEVTGVVPPEKCKEDRVCFKHCWLLLKDHPKWADGWSTPKAPTTMRVPAASDSEASNPEDAGRGSGGGA